MNRHASSSILTVTVVVHAVTSWLCRMCQPRRVLFVVMLLPYMYATELLGSRQAKLMAVCEAHGNFVQDLLVD